MRHQRISAVHARRDRSHRVRLVRSRRSQAPASRPPRPAATPAAFRVGFSVWDMQYEFFQAMEAGTREAAESRGWTFVLHDEKSDVNEMVTGATALLDEVDVLIISPVQARCPRAHRGGRQGEGHPRDRRRHRRRRHAVRRHRHLRQRRRWHAWPPSSWTSRSRPTARRQQEGRLHRLPARRGLRRSPQRGLRGAHQGAGLRRRDRPVRQLGRRAGLHGHEGRPGQGSRTSPASSPATTRWSAARSTPSRTPARTR